jgi:hypothetical protein
MPMVSPCSCEITDVPLQQEIKLSALRTKSSDEYAETDQEMANAMINAAKKTLISQVKPYFSLHSQKF